MNTEDGFILHPSQMNRRNAGHITRTHILQRCQPKKKKDKKITAGNYQETTDTTKFKIKCKYCDKEHKRNKNTYSILWENIFKLLTDR